MPSDDKSLRRGASLASQSFQSDFGIPLQGYSGIHNKRMNDLIAPPAYTLYSRFHVVTSEIALFQVIKKSEFRTDSGNLKRHSSFIFLGTLNIKMREEVFKRFNEEQ